MPRIFAAWRMNRLRDPRMVETASGVADRPSGNADGRMNSAPRRAVPASTTGLTLAIVGLAVAGIALIASRVGPLEVHAPPYQPPPPKAVPAPSAPPPQMTFEWQDRQADAASGEWLWWVGVVLAGLIGIAILIWLVRALLRGLARPSKPVVGGGGAPIVPTLWSRLTEPAEVDLGDGRTFHAGESADDIITSWEIIEQVADRIGRSRRESTTPTEFLRGLTDTMGDPLIDSRSDPTGARQVYNDVLRDAAAAGCISAAEVLLHLYHRARFDTATLAPGAASAARVAVASLVQAWDTSGQQG